MEPDTERMLTLEMLEGKESRGGRVLVVPVVVVVVVEAELASREELE